MVTWQVLAIYQWKLQQLEKQQAPSPLVSRWPQSDFKHQSADIPLLLGLLGFFTLDFCRCFLTLTQALALGYGGNPYGPAGTGKTESVKALGLALGRQVCTRVDLPVLSRAITCTKLGCVTGVAASSVSSAHALLVMTCTPTVYRAGCTPD
jgi:hypothetical protein